MIEETIQATSSPAVSDRPFNRLDPRVVRLWVVTSLIGYGVLLLMMLAALLFWSLARPRFLWWLMTGWLAVVVACVIYSFWHPPRAYRAWGYRLDDKVLETRSGLMFQRSQLLPLSRLQHVDLERGPFERMYGLASIVLHTAGTHSASIRIPGLDAQQAASLRDHLIEIGGDDAV